MDRKVILVTGASSGVGAAIAGQLCQAGHKVYGTSRNPSDVLKNGERRITYLAMDVTREASIQTAVEEIISQEGHIDVLVNNAGMGIAGPLELTSATEAALQMDTNFTGSVAVTRAVLPFMREKNGGSILSISSLAAQVPIPYQSLYSASKAALEITMEALAMEVKPFHIRTCCVELGDTHTAFTQNRKYVEAVQEDKAYKDCFLSSVHKMEEDETKGMDPSLVGRCVEKLLERRHLPLHYCCGIGAKAVYGLRKLLPRTWSHFVIEKLYSGK